MANLYTEEEVMMCTYIALYGRKNFTEKDICEFSKKREEGSMKMKLRNICTMLEEMGILLSIKYSKLSGLPKGQSGRDTNWEWVKKYLPDKINQQELLKKCLQKIKK